jgi:hypothetical protein
VTKASRQLNDRNPRFCGGVGNCDCCISANNWAARCCSRLLLLQWPRARCAPRALTRPANRSWLAWRNPRRQRSTESSTGFSLWRQQTSCLLDYGDLSGRCPNVAQRRGYRKSPDTATASGDLSRFSVMASARLWLRLSYLS